MIHIRIVYYQETIVTLFVGLHLYRRVLAVVFLDIQIQLTTDGMRINRCDYTFITLTQHQQNGIVHIIVNQEDGFLGGAYQVSSKLVGIKEMQCRQILPKLILLQVLAPSL